MVRTPFCRNWAGMRLFELEETATCSSRAKDRGSGLSPAGARTMVPSTRALPCSVTEEPLTSPTIRVVPDRSIGPFESTVPVISDVPEAEKPSRVDIAAARSADTASFFFCGVPVFPTRSTAQNSTSCVPSASVKAAA